MKMTSIIQCLTRKRMINLKNRIGLVKKEMAKITVAEDFK